jgi:major membrane immunogen (membrane-anchored lipoprotein)
MRRLVVLIAVSVLMTSCSREDDVTGSIHNKCATELYSAFNPKAMDQCMAVCLRCDRGTTTTCSTSCTLKGAH